MTEEEKLRRRVKRLLARMEQLLEYVRKHAPAFSGPVIFQLRMFEILESALRKLSLKARKPRGAKRGPNPKMRNKRRHGPAV